MEEKNASIFVMNKNGIGTGNTGHDMNEILSKNCSSNTTKKTMTGGCAEERKAKRASEPGTMGDP